MEDSQAKFGYNPCDIKMERRLFSIDNLLSKLKESSLVYHYDKPDFTTSWSDMV